MSQHLTSGHAVSRQQLRLLLTLAILALGAAPQPAAAGTYTVTGTCSWEPYNQALANLTVYSDGGDPSCPGRAARNVGGNFHTAAGLAAGWQFTAPAGSAISQLWAASVIIAKNGWQAGILASSGVTLFNCPFGSCPELVTGTWNLNESAVYTRVRCGSASGCYNGDISGYLRLLTANVTIADGTLPAVDAGGELASGGWKGGTAQLVIDANDNVGVKQVEAFIDGTRVVSAERPCDYRIKVPCPNGPSALAVPLGGVAEGRRTLTVQAIDTAGNVGSQSREILVDHTAPVAPADMAIAGGAGWRAQNSWTVRWTNPPQQLAPIAGIRYTLCPPAADSTDQNVAAKASKNCVSGSRSRSNLSEITDLELPKAGDAVVLRLWLVDAAGNNNPDSAVKIAGLGYDPTPPQVAGFAEQDPNDPARVTVRASDDGAPIIGGAIELRRHGAKAWRPLATDVRGAAISALVDDETLRKGRYELRATVVNAAGLQQGTDRTSDGKAMTLKLPIRMASRLRAGRLVGKSCDGHGAKRRCRQKLRRRVPVALGRQITLRGRLLVDGKPVKRQPLEVWQHVSLPGARWERIGSVQTNARGRYRYRAAAGPARALRFRYPGTPQIRGDSGTVRLQVQAATSIKSSRRHIINGEYVTFSGQLRGPWRPPAGVLVELQVFARGHWRTFAQPRADAATGAWSYQYRFETVNAGARFRFRARIRRQVGYPLATGHSRILRVSVRGL